MSEETIDKKIKNEIKKIHDNYCNNVNEIISNYGTEQGFSEDYEGRQIVELLQNADDEATGCTDGKIKKVLIEFDGNRLSVSNTGNPFSFDGVQSLMYPSKSPKNTQTKKIGCKGLGFRSILTWAKSVTIASRSFTTADSEEFVIKFSKKHAGEVLEDILNGKSKKEADEWRNQFKESYKDPLPIATLKCPEILEEKKLTAGYDTSIIIECQNDKLKTIFDQIKDLQPEELLFMPNLTEIEINCKYNDEIYNRTFVKDVVLQEHDVTIDIKDRDGSTIKTLKESKVKIKVEKNDGNTEKVWKLFREKNDNLPVNGEKKEYEFIMAYDPSGEHYGKVLYSYFKTDVELELPALIHGTFELESNRNNLKKNDATNIELMPRLANFMVACAIAISEDKDLPCNYIPLMLIITSKMDSKLKEYGLDTLLTEKAKNQKILPTIANTYISINDNPKYSAENFDMVLNPDKFPNMLKKAEKSYIEDYITNKKTGLNGLNINFYEYSEFCERVNKTAEDYTPEQKVEIIALVNKQYSKLKQNELSDDKYLHLLIDSEGNPILDESIVYPKPEGKTIKLPEWAKIKFLSQTMKDQLYPKLNVYDQRSLTNAFTGCNLKEYSFEQLLRGGWIDKVDLSEIECKDVLKFLWTYYSKEENPQSISDVKVKVICRDGHIEDARNCYMGSEYYDNALGERLVKNFSNNNFVVKPAELGLYCEDEDNTRIIGFLEWLGVSRYPRKTEKVLSGKEIEPFVNTCNPLYVQDDDISYEKFSTISTVKVGYFEHFDELLEKADFNDLLAWFLMDEEINKRLCSDSEEYNTSSCIKGKPPKKSAERTVLPSNIKSYIRYILSTTEWIPDRNGIKKKPSYCCFVDSDRDPINDLNSIIVVPDVNYEKIGNDCKEQVKGLLNKIGVANSFEEMQNTVIYETLMELPALDPDCKKGKSIFQKIIKSGLDPEYYTDNNPAYNKFIEKGMVPVKQGTKKSYKPVSTVSPDSEIYYADNKEYGEKILNEFLMFDADSHGGVDRIGKLFGVKPLKNIEVETEGTPVIDSEKNEAFKTEYESFKPYIRACRNIDIKTRDDSYSELNETEIVLCSKITIKYKIKSETTEQITEKSGIELGKFESVYLRSAKKAYICVPYYMNWDELKSDIDFSGAVAEIITLIIHSATDKNFYRDLFRESEKVRKMKMLEKGERYSDELQKESIDPREYFWAKMAELKGISVPEGSSAEKKMMAELKFDHTSDDIIYNDINNTSNAEKLIMIFQSLRVDVSEFNKKSGIIKIDLSNYWKDKLQDTINTYKNKYMAYRYNELKNNTELSDKERAERYYNFWDNYSRYVPENMNSVSVDIGKIFGVSLKDLDNNEQNLEEIYNKKKDELSKDTWEEAHQLVHNEKLIESYLIFDQIEALIKERKDKPTESSEPTGEQLPKPRLATELEDLAKEILDPSTELPKGFSYKNTSSELEKSGKGYPGKQSNKSADNKKTKQPDYEDEQRTAEKMGMAGESFVYREMCNDHDEFEDVTWVSKYAKIAGENPNGNDGDGYDIEYTDRSGKKHYVEVKASRNKDTITFTLTENELNKALANPDSYEIFYVVLDGFTPVQQPMVLKNLFKFDKNENLFYNKRFSISSSRYSITAKPESIKDA